MVTISLSLRAQVAVGTFFMKSLVPANQYCTDGYFFGKGSKMSAKYIKEKSQEYFMIRAKYLEPRNKNNSGGGLKKFMKCSDMSSTMTPDLIESVFRLVRILSISLSVCLSVGRSVYPKKNCPNSEMSEFSINVVLLHFF